MAEEAFLIKIKKASSPKAIKRLSDEIRRLKGRILLMTERGYVLIASLDSSYREVIQDRSEVELIGGIQLRPRAIRRIQVNQLGQKITPQLRQEGG